MIDGPNLYAYVNNNNPVNLVDAWGLCGEESWKNYFLEHFIRNLINDPPVIGISWTLFGISASITSNGIEFSYSFFTLVGVSLDVTSWNPKTNYELTFGAGKHFSIGIFPVEEGMVGITTPISVHAGESFGTFITFNHTCPNQSQS